MPKGTILGAAEEIADTLVASISNRDKKTPSGGAAKTGCDPKFRQYLDENLATYHLQKGR